MKIEDIAVLTPNEIRKEGLKALTEKLGPLGMVLFLRQFDAGNGDYTIERGQWLSGWTAEKIYEQLRKRI